MSSAIWKFTLDPFSGSVQMPRGAKLLHVHEQNGNICLWAECDPTAPVGERRVAIVPTGNEPPADCPDYIGSVHMFEHGLNLVFHIYARR